MSSSVEDKECACKEEAVRARDERNAKEKKRRGRPTWRQLLPGRN